MRSPGARPDLEPGDVLGAGPLGASSRSRTSTRRPPVEYLPTRTPPMRAFSVDATSSIETPMSAARARSGRMCSSGWPIR